MLGVAEGPARAAIRICTLINPVCLPPLPGWLRHPGRVLLQAVTSLSPSLRSGSTPSSLLELPLPRELFLQLLSTTEQQGRAGRALETLLSSRWGCMEAPAPRGSLPVLVEGVGAAQTCPPARLPSVTPAQQDVAASAAGRGAGIRDVTENPLPGYSEEHWHYGVSQGLRLWKFKSIFSS